MKSIGFLKTLGAVVCVTVACSVYAQDNTASSAAGTTATSPAPSKKAVRSANRKLGYSVRKALDKHGLDVSTLNVRARNGVVTLEGTVPSQDQIDKAAQVAQGVSGVKSVSNKLTLRTQ